MLDTPGYSTRIVALEQQLLRVRLAALTGTVPDLSEIKIVLERIEGMGRPRQAAGLALRLGLDCDHLGSTTDAMVLRQWADERLPEPARRTFWELWWAQPLEGPGPAPELPAASAGVTAHDAHVPGPDTQLPVEVRVLAPVLEIRRVGEAVRVREPVSKLLLALLIVHPAPLHVEQAMDRLWPDAASDTARPRLNTVVHRVRRVLGDRPAVVVRDGDLLSLDATAVQADLLDYRAALRQERTRRDAVVGLRGNLADVQFPYDDWFIEERRRLRTEWIYHAGELLRAGVVTWAELGSAATALGVELAL